MTDKPIRSAAKLSENARLAFLFKDSVIYGVAGALSKAFSLLTFPLLARHFSVTDYGVFDYFSVLANFLVIVFIFGQDSAVTRYFYEHNRSTDRRQLITQSLIFQAICLAIFIPILWWNAQPISAWLQPDRPSIDLFQVVLLQLPFILAMNFSQNLLKICFERNKFLVMTLGATVLQASALIIAVLVFDAGIREVLIASLISYAAFGCIGLFFIRRWLAVPQGFARLREMMPFALPYGLLCVVSAFLPAIERGLTNHLLGPDDLGLYAAGAKIAFLLGMVVAAFQTAWEPFSISIHKETDAARTYNRVLQLYSLAIAVCTLLLFMVAQPLIIILSSERYSGAVVLVFPLAMALAINATGMVTEIGIDIAKRSHLNLISHLVGLLVSSAGIWVFAKELGLFGVGIGVLVGQTARTLLGTWLAQQAHPMPWSFRNVIGLLALTTVFGLAATLISQVAGGYFHVVLTGLAVCGLVIWGWFRVLNVAERHIARTFIVGRLRP